jgi:hypothetical protein
MSEELPPLESRPSYTVESITEAVSALSSRDPQVAEEAAHFIDAWPASPDNLMSMCQVLQESSDASVQLIAARALERVLPRAWGSVTPEAKAGITGLILEQAQNVPVNVATNLLQAYAHVVLYDFPDEMDANDVILFPERESPFTIALLSTVLQDLDTATFITGRRRQALRNYFLFFFPRALFPRIAAALGNAGTARFALEAYQSLLPIISLRNQDDIISVLLAEFAGRDDTRDITLGCLTRIFANHKDSEHMMRRKADELLQLLTRGVSQHGQPLTNFPCVIEFMIAFLTHYMIVLIKTTPEGTPKEEVLVELVQVMLSIAETDLTPDFWAFWALTLDTGVQEALNDNPARQRVLRFLQGCIGPIRESLFGYLESSVSDDGLLWYTAANAMGKLAELDFAAMCEFLGQDQSPSPSLCYAVGCLTRVRASPEEMVQVRQIVEALCAFGQESLKTASNPGYITALLWGLSQEPVFLNGWDLFDRFFNFTLECLSSAEEVVVSAATRAFDSLSKKDIDHFLHDGAECALQMAQESERFIEVLLYPAACRMFLCVSRVLSMTSENQEGFATLFQPVLDRLAPDSEAADMLYDSLELVRETADTLMAEWESEKDREKEPKRRALRQAVAAIGHVLLPAIFDLVHKVGPDLSVSVEHVEVVMTTEAALLRGLSWESATDAVGELLELASAREQLMGSVFAALLKLRTTFSEVTAMSEQIITQLMIPASQSEDRPLAEMLQLVAALKGGWVDYDWLVETALAALGTYNPEENRAATRALIRAFREMNTANFTVLVQLYGDHLVHQIFVAMTDAMHKDELDYYVKLLMKIWSFIDSELLGGAWIGLLVDQLATVLGDEPEPEFYLTFVMHLKDLIGRPDIHEVRNGFRDAFVQFLIMAQKMSPGDSSIFTEKAWRSRDFDHSRLIDFQDLEDLLDSAHGSFV